MTYIINDTTRTIFLTTSKLNITFSLATFILAVNSYLHTSSKPITEFQLALTITDIGCNMVLLIVLPKDIKKVLKVIRNQVYLACKVEVVHV